ncbi:MAG: HAD domain-containing protein [Rhodoferax sp.]|nr:HAD domain-containing protein [Rhodoferax sp.]
MIVFLDFDGVTHPEPCEVDALFVRLPLIEAVLREFDLPRIVISSSWREVHPLGELLEFFSADLAPRVLDVTPLLERLNDRWLPGQSQRFERQNECERWMRENRPWGTPWLAIDDRAHWFEPQCQHLLLTDPDHGFLPGDAPRLRAMIQERL